MALCAAALAAAPVDPACEPAVPGKSRSPGTCGASVRASAESLLAMGRFWHAWRALPPLRPGTRPLPAESIVLYGTAAEGLGRFRQVDELLRRASGRGAMPAFLLLGARAYERAERWRGAESKYRQVLRVADTTDDARAVATVRLAMVLEQAGRRDSAMAAWRRAALAIPELADWFALRRAALEEDTAVAFAMVSGPRTPGALRNAQLFVAQRRASAGDLLGALDLFQRFGKSLDVARVEYTLGRRQLARARADSALFHDPSNILNANAFLAATFLTERLDALSAAENLAVSRTYRVRGQRLVAERFVRAAIATSERLHADTGAVDAWLEMARLQSDRRNLPRALRAVDSAGARAGPARAGLIGAARVQAYAAAERWGAADTLVALLAQAHPGDTSVARALLQLADRQRARGDTAPERARYVTLLRLFSDAPAANAARFRLGLAAYMAGARDTALAIVRSAARRDSTHALGLGPRYWTARIRLELRDTAGATELRRIAREQPLSFYGVRARETLGDTAFLSDTVLGLPRQGTFPPARARERIRLLASLGLDQEARAEATGWTVDSSASVYVLMAAALGAGDAGYARESIALVEAVRQRVGIVRGAAGALFPIAYRGVIDGEADELCIDPLLVAALIRQESRFDPHALSRVGARGISQVMPATGREMAGRLRLGPWDGQLLFVPDFNVHLGVRYVRDRQDRDSFPVYALLASYNAGAGRVGRWKSWPEYPDPDLFAERVSIVETRDYVRNVYASYVWYQYAWKPSPPAPAERPASLVP